jgi:hypothetical protein
MSDPHALPLDDEPRTPLWLPALGGAIFVAAALWWAVTPSSAAPAGEGAPSASVSATAPAAPPAVASAGTPQPPATALATAQLAPSARPVLAPGMASAEMQQRMKELRDRMKPAGGKHP